MQDKGIKVLIIDDDQSIRNMLSIVLKNEGYDVIAVESAIVALKKLKKEMVDLIISDIKMPEISGIELLRKVKSIDQEIPVIMITGFASTNDAVEAMKLGAEDYIIKPFNLDELKIIINKSIHRKTIEKENIELKSKLTEKEKFENIVGKNSKMLKIFDLIDTISQTDSTVLISGESGTGKELIARAIHNKSPRAQNNFVSINCGALPENLLESELFGHSKGAFTDAYRDKIGLFEVADKGTLFLDEIGEMPQPMQVKLLRAIQERIIRRVGSNNEIAIDVRIISATNKDLLDTMTNGKFRSDLFYRLNVISINVPPLKDRKDDIPLLMHNILNNLNKRFNKRIEGYEREVIDLFMKYPWPGNVRELENFIERSVALEKENVVTTKSLPKELVYNISESVMSVDSIDSLLAESDFDYTGYMDKISQQVLVKALEKNHSNLKMTAEMLNISYRSLRYLISKFNLKV
ncbi:MAG: sigma-54-dependent Fis family transcriptional regulator [Candidatus Aminicenantes bacterium]|nr:sigma-54-dependent Fis family transcriptional regulator [Candidatus Aminicenantes bacterium]